MSVKERLKLFIAFKKLSQSKFEKTVGLSNGYVNNIRKSISEEALQKIAQRFPDLNKGWLLTGEGTMLYRHMGVWDLFDQLDSGRKPLMDLIYRAGYTQEEAANELDLSIEVVQDMIRRSLLELKQKLEESTPLPIIDKTDVVSDDHDKESRDMEYGLVFVTIPIVPEFEYAIYPHRWNDPEYIEELPRHSILLPIRDNSRYLAFTVRGDGMNDGSAKSICEDDIAVGRLIGADRWYTRNYILVGKDYIIVSAEGIVVKRISRWDSVHGIITCTSANPDKVNYPDYDIDLADVFQVFKVVKIERDW